MVFFPGTQADVRSPALSGSEDVCLSFILGLCERGREKGNGSNDSAAASGSAIHVPESVSSSVQWGQLHPFSV